MGADNFAVINLGRNAVEAFTKAQNEAYWEFGHGGYTGTIAEKPGYKFAGQVSSRHVDRLETYFFAQMDTHYDMHGPNQGRIPESMRPVIAKFYDMWDDKWGPAVCFEITGTRAIEIKARAGRKGTMDKVYIFLGFASS